MNPSILISPPSSPHPTTLFSPFLNPSPLRFSITPSISLSTNHHHRRYRYSYRYRISAVRCSSSDDSSDHLVSAKPVSSDVFGGKRELSGFQSLVESMSPPIRVTSSALIVAGAIAAGYGLGFRFGGDRRAGLGAAVVLGAAGAGAAYAMNSSVPEVAAVNLHNYVAGCDDPSSVKKEEIEGIASKYGVSKQNEAFNAELCELYSRFVASVLPPGSEDLTGNEVETIIKFKNALGIDDPDAAAMHMEIGRQIFRQRLETGDRDGDREQRRAFQKLIYVSTLVFGEASAFLLPWKRVFKVTDAQVEVAIRDNAQRLYAIKLESVSRDVDVEQLISLREAQILYRLSDELAADMFKERTRKLVEENLSTALSTLKSRTRAVGATHVIEELDKILGFNSLLISLKNHPDAGRFACGIGPVTLLGGEYNGDRKMDDLKLLYRAYVTDSLSSGRMEENKLAALNQLRNIFGLGKREAESITLDVTSKVYRKRLAQAVSGGDLEAADSKAAVLQNLCEELYFDPQKAIEIHNEIYRQKLQQAVSDGELNEENVKALERLQIMLCIPKQTVEAAHEDICGSLFEKVVKEAIASGVDGYDADVKKSVRKAAHGLRLTREVAMSIASKAVRKIFINYVKQSRAAGSRIETAKTLKKMIAFNSLVVTELVADIKGDTSDTTSEESIVDLERETDVDEEWDTLQSLRKVKPNKESSGKLGKEIQTEISLKDDLPERDRTDLYKTYLLYCLTGEVTRIPFGAQITTKRDDHEYVLLSQLGKILGLTNKEIVDVHRSLAEQAFKQQAEVILADGQLSKARIEQLNELQKQVGLPPQYAQKIIKTITTTKMAAALESAVGQGRLSIKEIRDLKEAGVELDTMVSENLRENLFKEIVKKIFSSGTGEFDEEELFQKIPCDLNVNVEKAKRVVHELARKGLEDSLLEAVSSLRLSRNQAGSPRQRNQARAVSSLNDCLACDKAVPSSEPLSGVKATADELHDLFRIYAKSNPAPEKLSRLQYLLDISDSTAEALRGMEDIGLLNGAEEEFVF